HRLLCKHRNVRMSDVTHALPRIPSLKLASVELVVVRGPASGTRVSLRSGTTRIGSSAACAMVVPDPTVSRIHCEVTVSQDGVVVQDSGSTNGTFVDGVH